MATIDILTLAQRAKDAGMGVAEFIRSCFEAGPEMARTPTPAGPVPIPYPNLSVARRPGALPISIGAPNLASRVGQTDPLADAAAAFLAVVRAAITETTANERANYNDRSAMLQEAKQRWRMSQDAALEELFIGLWSASAYALSADAALLAVLRQAQATFRWQRQETRVRQELIANFVVQVARAAMRTFRMSAQIAAQAIVRAATAVEADLAAVLPVIIAILVTLFGYGAVSSSIVNVVAAVRTATDSAIRMALTAAFAGGVSAAVVARSGLDWLGRTGTDWAKLVAQAWRDAPTRPALIDLVRALRDVPGVTANHLMDGLVRWLCGAGTRGISSEDLAVALHNVFGNASLGAFVHAVAEVLGLSAEKIAVLIYSKFGIDLASLANALIAEFGRDPNLLARAFKEVHAGAGAAAVALRGAGCSALDVARVLKDVFGLGRDQVASELANAGFNASDVAQALSNLFQSAGDAVRSFVSGLG